MVFSNPWTPSLRMSPLLRPATSVVPIGDTRKENTAGKETCPAGPQIPPEASLTACRQCKLSPRSSRSRDRPGPPIYSQKRLEQFADKVNSHPASLGHGNPHKDPKYQTGRGKIPRSHWSVLRVTNHCPISRGRQARHGQR